MSALVNSAIGAAVAKILFPLARLLIRHGMAVNTFEQIARKAFVDAGVANMEDSGLRPTVSGIATLTGLSRKEVTRLQGIAFADENQPQQRYNRAVRIISGWVNDSRFMHDNEPAVLPIEGAANSFSELVRIYGGDVTPGSLLSVLSKSGNVHEREGSVELVKRAYIPMETEPDTLNILGVDTAELIQTISYNISAAPDVRLFQRKVSTARLSAEAVSAFRQYSSTESQRLLEDYDAWLAAHEVENDKSSEATYVAVGIYYADRAPLEEK